MKQRKFFIQEHINRKVDHGGIGNVDIEKILLQLNFKPIIFPGQNSFSFLSKLRRVVYCVRMLNLPNGSLVFYQFPQHAFLHRFFIKTLLRLKKISVICHLTDINGLKDGNPGILAAEIELIRKHKYFIIHNDKMGEWLTGVHPDAVYTGIDFFDFLAGSHKGKRQKDLSIAFAGYLPKSGFLKKLPGLISQQDSKVTFHLYGPGHEVTMSGENINYHGVVEPYSLPGDILGSFGLVWDGESLDELAGSFGNYMRYISQHKLSLYILAGMPVIVPNDTVAELLVRKYGIGFAVSSVSEIASAISKLTDTEYEEMVTNMKPIRQKISTGLLLTEALDKLIDQINRKNKSIP